jgi:hypothetical protein
MAFKTGQTAQPAQLLFSPKETPMANVENPGAAGSPRNGGRGAAPPETPRDTSREGPAPREAARAAGEAGSRSFEAGARQAQENARAAEAVADKTADASRAAAKANAEIAQSHIETSHEAMRSSLDAWTRTVEGLTQSWTRVLGVTNPNPDLADEAARNVHAVSQASTALVKGSQDASRAWFELTQRTVRTNLEALERLAHCRSVQEVVTVHSNLLRDNLQQAMESGETVARTSSDAIREATRAMQSQQPGAGG